jgi:hypothetical protein
VDRFEKNYCEARVGMRMPLYAILNVINAGTYFRESAREWIYFLGMSPSEFQQKPDG